MFVRFPLEFLSSPALKYMPDQGEADKEYKEFRMRFNGETERKKQGAADSRTCEFGYHGNGLETDGVAVVYYDIIGRPFAMEVYNGAYPNYLIRKRWGKLDEPKI